MYFSTHPPPLFASLISFEWAISQKETKKQPTGTYTDEKSSKNQNLAAIRVNFVF